jgi:predicted metal-dependent hydrolase
MADDSEQLEPGRAAFNRGEYFLAHELWEEVWHQIDDAERRLSVQGLIQIAAGLHHLQQRRARPAAGLLRKGLEKISKRPKGSLPLELLVGQVERLLVELQAPGQATTEETGLTAVTDLSRIKL